nr:DNA helicase [Tanacetum cinerariifolium]
MHSVSAKKNHDQKKIYDLIIGASATNQQELLFVYGHGSIGKTFLWKTIISSLRCQRPTAGALQEKEIVTYLSNDEAIPTGRETSEKELLYLMEYLNTITFRGFPPHELKLKNTIASLKIGQPNTILEAKVYQKWIAKSVPDMKELAFCCILIDKEGQASVLTFASVFMGVSYAYDIRGRKKHADECLGNDEPKHLFPLTKDYMRMEGKKSLAYDFLSSSEDY